ncbi:MAG TPA: hypothetical protein IAC41_11810 [Candidatus Merdenecus merdavium]|nr:hypothetical protein [Candidatus Merdenecus merdavium]
MNKKHLRLYIALFLVSMLISATAIMAYAANQQTTTVTYTALSPEEKNHYEVVIPSAIQLNADGGSMTVSVADGYELESDYQVNVSISADSWEKITSGTSLSTTSTYNYKLHLNGDKSSPYYLKLDLTTSTGKAITPSTSTKVLCFRQTGIYSEANGSDGTITFTRAAGSTDKNYKEAGDFSGTLTFNISGSYY